jgi:hypothetical protein
MHKSPEQMSDKTAEIAVTGPENHSNTVGRKRNLLAAAILAVAAAGCDSCGNEHAKTDGMASVDAGTSATTGITTETPPKTQSAAEFIQETCNKSINIKADNKGFNRQYVVHLSGDKKHVIKPCAAGGAQEVKTNETRCGFEIQNSDGTRDFVPYSARPDAATVGEVFWMKKPGINKFPFNSLDGFVGEVDEKDYIAVATTERGKINCDQDAPKATVAVRTVERPRANYATVAQLNEVKTAVEGLGKEFHSFVDTMAGAKKIDITECINHEITPLQCRRQEQEHHNYNSADVQATRKAQQTDKSGK